jgi:DNA-binding CsgD family transcriptional regulator
MREALFVRKKMERFAALGCTFGDDHEELGIPSDVNEVLKQAGVDAARLEHHVDVPGRPTGLDQPLRAGTGVGPAGNGILMDPGARLIGRDPERRVLDRLLQDVRAGSSRALVVHGDAGAGKTALLDYTARRAPDCRVVSTTAAQAEMDFGFAALHQLCKPVLGHLDAVPPPQREALRITFGIASGRVPDRILVGLAVLSLLAEAAVGRPLLCLIDDEQWLDRASAQVLAFVARRLGAESVGLVFAARVPSMELAGLAQLPVGRLADAEAQALLSSVLTGPVDTRVRDRIVAEAHGNPLALLELPRGLTAAELAGWFGVPGAAAAPGGVDESFRRRAEALPPEAQRLLLLAAADPLGDSTLVWRAASLLQIDANAARPAAEAGLAEIGTRVRFRHPLVRSAVYRVASIEERQLVHRALADATDPEADPDYRAWHLGQASPGPDEVVASELERSVGRAQARGGLAVGATLLRLAATLTPDPHQRSRRALAGAKASLHAGAPDASSGLLSLAETGSCDSAQRAEIELLRAQTSFTLTRGGHSVSLLLNAARQLEPINPRLSRETYLDALMAAMFAGHLAVGDGVTEAARAAKAAQVPHDQLPADLLLNGLAVRFTDGYVAAMPLLRRAVTAFSQADVPPEQMRWLWLARIVAGSLWDEQTLDSVHDVDITRNTGALATLPLALATRVGALVVIGNLSAAAVMLEAESAVTQSTGIPSAPYGALLLAAWRGRESEVLPLVQAATEETVRRREGFGLIITGFAEAMLANSLRRYKEAVKAAEVARGYPATMGVEPWGLLAELVEGAARSGQSAVAGRAFQELAVTTRAASSDWALGIEARSLALLSFGAEAEAAYQDAINRLEATKIRGELARAHLLYGEWLRREKRRAEARGRLRVAHELFCEMGMEAFAARAASELRATGDTGRQRRLATFRELTAQEAQVARLASQGLTNQEIGSRLFISARTVQYHLSKVFTKMNLTSRNQLSRALASRTR